MPFLLHQLLTESAERDPEQLAVVGSDHRLTYGELDALSNQIAHQLRADGVRAGDRVGMFLTKSPHAVAALFGIQKAGAAYVPVDPHCPPQRATYILDDCGVTGLVTSSDKLAFFPCDWFKETGISSIVLCDGPTSSHHSTDLPITSLAEIAATRPKVNPSIAITENDLAYILYTSGSTGRPKGVMISHLNSLTFVNWCNGEFKIQKTDHVSSHAPFHFDLSVFDLFSTIKAGATVYLVPSEVQAFPGELARWIAGQGITVWYSVPSALIQLVERGRLENYSYEKLRLVLFAGEVFPVKYLRELIRSVPHPSYYNLYGPTETNVCTYYKVKQSDVGPESTEAVPIGAACANTDVFALDQAMKPVGVGEQGELYVQSSTVMKGYWGHPDASARVVVPNVLNPHYAETIYCTGDIVELLPGGDYRYIGRRDKMIKSRGYRIELGEIESALYSHQDVREAAVIAVPDDQVGARIGAYVVCDNGATRQHLEKYCLERLPRYMIPERFELRDELPKTSTGKIDRTSLEEEMKNPCPVKQ
jgi:L-proline---[L-prolyl-carrier protein] ligase